MYCTLDDIKIYLPEDQLIQLTDDSNTGEVDATIVEAVINDASELVDGYLSALYVVPMEDSPKLIKSITTDISAYLLYSRRLATDMPESLTTRYKNALALLERIKRGEITIGAGQTSDTTPSGIVVSNSRRRIFTDL